MTWILDFSEPRTLEYKYYRDSSDKYTILHKMPQNYIYLAKVIKNWEFFVSNDNFFSYGYNPIVNDGKKPTHDQQMQANEELHNVLDTIVDNNIIEELHPEKIEQGTLINDRYPGYKLILSNKNKMFQATISSGKMKPSVSTSGNLTGIYKEIWESFLNQYS